MNELIEFAGRLKRQKIQNGRNQKAVSVTLNEESSPIHAGLALVESNPNYPLFAPKVMKVNTPLSLTTD